MASRRCRTVTVPYKGSPCQHEACGHKAYYYLRKDQVALCGRHSAKAKAQRENLPADPNAKTKLRDFIAHKYGGDAVLNEGKLSLARMRMMQPQHEIYLVGFQPVLPNNRAVTDVAGFALAYQELSPMRLGPVKHLQPGLPDAMNLENLHQFGKVFSSEADGDTMEDAKVHAQWYARRLQGYLDKEPHRHKLGSTKQEHMKAAGIAGGANANHCLFSIYIMPDGTERRLTYVQSRVIYCNFYEQLASQTGKYRDLLHRHNDNRQNLLLLGYDTPIYGEDDTLHTSLPDALCDKLAAGSDTTVAQTFEAWYRDDRTPFGHEKVLLVMLRLCKTQNLYPWRRAAVELGMEHLLGHGDTHPL